MKLTGDNYTLTPAEKNSGQLPLLDME